MGTILASTSRADGAADTTSKALAFDPIDVFIATSATSSTAPPSIGGDVVLQLSTDNTNWTSVDRRHFGIAPGITYEQKFEMSDYVTAYQSAWLYAQLVFTGNSGGAVTVAATSMTHEYVAIVALTATTATTGGAVAAWANPATTAVLVTRVVANVTTKSSGAANLSIGVAANATTSSTTFHAAAAVGSAAVVLDSVTGGGSSASIGAQVLASGSYITVTGSADTTGMVGSLYIYYFKP